MNRLEDNESRRTDYHLYDAANQLKEIHAGSAAGALTAAFLYDDNGNLTQKCEGTGVTASASSCSGSIVTALAYDARNRLVQADRTGQPTQRYGYDDAGRRIRKTVGTTSTHYLYNGPDIVAEYTNSFSQASARYTHGPNTDDPILREAGTTTQYYHQDGLGSVVATSDAAGMALASSQLFDAWGNRIAAASRGSIPTYGYTGREPDETGLIYYRARYYDPSIGRFTQRDPIGLAGGLNQYAYVGNNPVLLTDPSGLLPASPLAPPTPSYPSGCIAYLEPDEPETMSDADPTQRYDFGNGPVVVAQAACGPSVDAQGRLTHSMSLTNPATDALLAATRAFMPTGEEMSVLTGIGTAALVEPTPFGEIGLLGAAGVVGIRGVGRVVDNLLIGTTKIGPGEDLFVGLYGQSRRGNIATGLNATHAPHHAVQDAVTKRYTNIAS